MNQVAVGVFLNIGQDGALTALGVEHDRFAVVVGEPELGLENTRLLQQIHVRPNAVHANFANDVGGFQVGRDLGPAQFGGLPGMNAKAQWLMAVDELTIGFPFGG